MAVTLLRQEVLCPHLSSQPHDQIADLREWEEGGGEEKEGEGREERR
jgi:hypothetical protein